MTKFRMTMVLAAAVLLLAASSARSQSGHHSFDVTAANIGSFATGSVLLTGGGNYDAAAGFVKAGGSFQCLSDVTGGPLRGLRAGEGVRWQAKQLLASSGFKCSGDPGETLKTASTDDHTVVFVADFFRQGDGAVPSFTAKVFLSAGDLGTDVPGSQTAWIQGVGCGDAFVNLR